MAHHPSFGLSPANGTLPVPRSYGSAASPVDLTSSAAYSSFKSIWSTKIHDMLKPTANLPSCRRTRSLCDHGNGVAMPIPTILQRNVATGAMSAEGSGFGLLQHSPARQKYLRFQTESLQCSELAFRVRDLKCSQRRSGPSLLDSV